MADGIQPAMNQPEPPQEQQQWLGHGSATAWPCNEPDGLHAPPRPCSPEPFDGRPSSDEPIFHPAGDWSSLLSHYVFNHPSFLPAPVLAPDSLLPSCPSFGLAAHHTPPPPQHARPAAVGRRATFSSVPSRLPLADQGYAPGLAPLYPANASPATLDAAYSLLAGWGNTPSSFPLFNQPTQEQRFNVDNEALAEQYMCSSGSLVSCANGVLQMAPSGGSSGTDGLDPPPSTTYHHPHSQSPPGNHNPSSVQLTPQYGLEFQPSPSLWAPSNHTLAHSLTTSNQHSPALPYFGPTHPPPIEVSPEWNTESSYATDQPGHSSGLSNQNWDQSPEAASGLVFLDGGIPLAVSNSPVPTSYYPDPRCASHPSPVAPIAQRPWDPHHRYSVANISCHVLEGTTDGPQYFDSTTLPYDLPASYTGSSRHAGSFSTTVSHLYSGDLSTPSTAGFGSEVCDHWAQLALHNFEDQAASFGNTSIPSNEALAPIDSPQQKSPSCRSKSSGLDSAHDALPPPNVELGNFSFDPDAEKDKVDLQTPRKRGRAAALSGTIAPSSLPPEVLAASNRAHFATEHMDGFRQARHLPFGLLPHPNLPLSPYTPSAVFPSQADFSQTYQGIIPMGDSLQDSSSAPPHLPQFGLREARIKPQNLPRRYTLMAQPSWPESHIGARAIESSPSSSFRRYQERAECNLSSSPEKSLREKGRGGPLRKRKSMNKDYRFNQMTAPAEPEHDSSGNERGESEVSSGILFREVSFRNEDRMSQEPSGPPGGCGPGIRSTPPHNLVRFGGIGQGGSPHPPGLSGSVRPSVLDLTGVMDEAGEIMIPWQQELRCDEDLYTPMWCRGQNEKKEGFCDMCEGGAWFRLKNSAYWYHKQYFHGVSSTTGHYFYPPKEIKRGFSTANRQQILGMCHECEEWVGFSSIIGTGTIKKNVPLRNGLAEEDGGPGPRPEWLDFDESGTSKVPTLWYKHAHKCHRHQTCKGAKGRKKAKRA